MTHESIRIIQDEHIALTTMLRSLELLVERGPDNEPENFFDVLRAMLFYIDEFPERQHHPKESLLLFPRVARMAPDTEEVIARLEQEHVSGALAVRELQHLLLAWELVGDSRHAAFEQAARQFLNFYREHMRLEDEVILPAAMRVLNEADWEELDAAFRSNRDPLTGHYPRDPVYDRLFTRVVRRVSLATGSGKA